MANDLKLKGPVREIGIIRDHDRHDSFNITIGITIKTEGKVTYEEAERLSAKFRREYLGKDVEFRSIYIPCPYCDKILNSETGVKRHIIQIHPEKSELINPLKVAVNVEKPENKARGKKAKKSVKKAGEPAEKTGKRKSNTKKETPVKAANTGKTADPKKLKAEPKAKKTRVAPKADVQEPVRSKVKVEPYKPASILGAPAKRSRAKSTPKAKQLTLA